MSVMNAWVDGVNILYRRGRGRLGHVPGVRPSRRVRNHCSKGASTKRRSNAQSIGGRSSSCLSAEKLCADELRASYSLSPSFASSVQHASYIHVSAFSSASPRPACPSSPRHRSLRAPIAHRQSRQSDPFTSTLRHLPRSIPSTLPQPSSSTSSASFGKPTPRLTTRTLSGKRQRPSTSTSSASCSGKTGKSHSSGASPSGMVGRTGEFKAAVARQVLDGVREPSRHFYRHFLSLFNNQDCVPMFSNRPRSLPTSIPRTARRCAALGVR